MKQQKNDKIKVIKSFEISTSKSSGRGPWTRRELKFLVREGCISHRLRKAILRYFKKCDGALAEVTRVEPPPGFNPRLKVF